MDGMSTTQITVRNVDPILKQRINKLAKLKSMSINDFVLDTLRTKVEMKTIKKDLAREGSWHRYSGTIGGQGISQDVLDDFETVDKAMWE